MRAHGSLTHLVVVGSGLGLALLLAIAPGTGAAGAVYQWTDADGVVHFSDDPGKIPKKFHGTVQELRRPDEPKAPNGINPEDAQGAQESVSKPAEAVDADGHNREWWQQRVRKWEQKKTDAQANLADAQERLGKERFLNATTGNMQRIQDISAEVSKYENDLREAENMLSDGLPDEARRAQAPPGWLRE